MFNLSRQPHMRTTLFDIADIFFDDLSIVKVAVNVGFRVKTTSLLFIEVHPYLPSLVYL